jgi:8-oxo-dGTP diphosphatase
MRIGGAACFLPGGGAEPGEAPEQTLARELREECGRAARILRRLGEATQLISRGGRFIAKRGIYFEARFTDDSSRCPVEPDHELLWLPPADAIARLKHESQRWAVEAWMREHR